jgi:hypothetical protein
MIRWPLHPILSFSKLLFYDGRTSVPSWKKDERPMVRTLPVAAWHSMPAYDMIHTLRGLCRREVESLCDFLEGLATIDQKGIHLELGFPNLFELCRIEFGLSEGCIYRRIQVARKLRHYPELLRALRSGDINLSLSRTACLGDAAELRAWSEQAPGMQSSSRPRPAGQNSRWTDVPSPVSGGRAL